LSLEVFTQTNFVADFTRHKWNFVFKKWRIHFLSHPLGDLGCNVCTSSMAHWKACGQLPMGQFECKFHMKGEFAHQSLLVSENKSDFGYMWYENIESMCFCFVTKDMCECVTDGQTDRHTQLRLQRPR